MSFKDCLNQYMAELECTARELSEASGVSPAVISRYRSGERSPGAESAQLAALAKGIAILSGHKGPSPFSEDEVYMAMLQSVTGIRIDYGAYMSNLHSLLAALSIGNNELARALNLDPSYISRILSKKRRPADLSSFIDMISAYIARRYNSSLDIKNVADLTDRNEEEFAKEDSYAAVISDWLGTCTKTRINNIAGFYERLDRYEIEREEPEPPEREEPSSSGLFFGKKTYRGYKGLFQAERDYLEMILKDRSPGKIVIYSDWAMDKQTVAPDLLVLRREAIRTAVRNGAEVYVIHNVHRPFREMMESLESWIPLYMTGKVFPYYLKMPQGDPFVRIMGKSSHVVFSGNAILGHEQEGLIQVTDDPKEVAFFGQQMDWLLKKASPLMEIYVSGKEQSTKKAFFEVLELQGKRTIEMCTLPVFTLSEELLTSMLDRMKVRGRERKEIFSYFRYVKEKVFKTADHSVYQVNIPRPDENAFYRGNYTLSLSGMFNEKEYPYTYEEYQEHLRLTLEAEKNNRGLIITSVSSPAFHNLNIILSEGKYLLISKNNYPAAHFLMRFPWILQAAENFSIKVERD